MIHEGALSAIRAALAELPDETSYGEVPPVEQVYLPRSHLKAMDPNRLVITGMRGAGKTFWWGALQDPSVRRLLGKSAPRISALDTSTEVRRGFGVKPEPDDYPSRDELRCLMADGVDPRMIWRTVQARQIGEDRHPLRQQESWSASVAYAGAHPEQIGRLFGQRDRELDQRGVYLLVLFDALDLCADEWREMNRAIRGLMQTALEMRSYRRLRVKMFLRSDQISEAEIANFPDASKVLSSNVELSWPRHELYGLLWHLLVNGRQGAFFRDFLRDEAWEPEVIGESPVHIMPRSLVTEAFHRRKFHDVAGRWMGRGPRRGFPYTWIPNHLGDADGRVSPRSFLAALRTAADDTMNREGNSKYALHYDSIKRGVQEASRIRVRELREDYPWVDDVLNPLKGRVVPCQFDEIQECWESQEVIPRLRRKVEQGTTKLPPQHVDDGSDGVRRDLETLGIFLRMHDGRVNIPDVFRVGYGLGRRGGVRPAG